MAAKKIDTELIAGCLNSIEDGIELLPSDQRDSAERLVSQLGSHFDITPVVCTPDTDGSDRGRGWYANGSKLLTDAKAAYEHDKTQKA